MSHFAQINKDNIVTQVIVAEQDFIDSGLVGDPTIWIQTSYNTSLGTHLYGGIPLRKNYAGIGYTYNKDIDAFIPPAPYPSWILDLDTCSWFPPKLVPDDGKQYIWDENLIDWVEQGS